METKKLIDCCEFISDGDHLPPPKSDSGVPFITISNITGQNKLSFEDTMFVPESYYNGLNENKKAQKGDILYSVVGSFGKPVYVDFDKQMVFQRHIAILRPKRNVNARFIYYTMLNPQFYKLVDKLAIGCSQRTVTLDTLRNIEVNLPDKDIQDKMVGILSLIDEKIANNNAINDNLEQQAQAIYHERFETISPNDLPSEWRIVTLGEVATISSKSFNPLKEPEILLEHYSIPAFDEARFPVFELSTSIKSNKFIIDASCFMISKLNPTTKRVWKPYCLTGNAVCSTEFIVYKAKDKTITDFLYSVIDSNSFSDFMCTHVTGSTGSRQRTTPSDTLSYELILPSEDELAKFQSLVSPMYAQIRINAIENDRLKRLRDSLLPKLMSGEIDVSTIQL